jgi:hypothetical protein
MAMLLVGDFNQLDPVGDINIEGISKQPNINNIRQLSKSLFILYNVYQLQKVERQTELETVEAFNNLGNGKLT